MSPPSPRPRRHPRFGRFIGTGAVAGLIIGYVITTATGNNGDYGFRTAFGYVGLFFAFLGALAAAVIAVVLAGRE